MELPNPGFDSGWLIISQGQEWGLGFNTDLLGNDIDECVVNLEFMQDNNTLGIHNRGFGSTSTRSLDAFCETGRFKYPGVITKTLPPAA